MSKRLKRDSPEWKKRIDDIRFFRACGIDTERIAMDAGISPQMVNRICKAERIPSPEPGRSRRLSDVQIEVVYATIERLRSEGMTQLKIADELKRTGLMLSISQSTISRWEEPTAFLK